MPLFDIAVNASNKQLASDFAGLLERSREAAVDKWLMVGCDVDESREVLAMAEAAPDGQGLYCTAGVHPHDAKSVSTDYIAQLRQLHTNPKVVAVGECGLDFNRDFSPRPQQEKVFVEQLELALELGKPVYMHERDAGERFVELFKPFANQLSRGVVHCFTGNRETLEQYLEMGLSIGVTGWVCDERRGEQLQSLVPHIPIDRLMIETDAPFLLPRTIKPKPKSRRNEPAYLTYVAQTVAELRGLSFDELAQATYDNSCRFFNVEPLKTEQAR